MRATAMFKVRFAIISVACLSFCSLAQTVDTVKVMGRGVGTDKIEALKDAYRDAVERAVGLYVDAEQMMKNEELVKDQILTQANAYIEKYEIVRENSKQNGLVAIQILAEVRKKVLSNKVSNIMPTKTYALGDELKRAHAKDTTLKRRNQDGAKLLKAHLNEFDPLRLTLDLSLASPKVNIQDADAKKVKARYLFCTTVNLDRYFSQVVPRLRDVLHQVSIAEPSVEHVSVVMNSEFNLANFSGRDVGIETDMGEVNTSFLNDCKGREVAIVVGVSKNGKVWNVERFWLDEECYRALGDWCSEVYNYSSGKMIMDQRDYDCTYCGKKIRFKLTFLDSTGNPVFCDNFVMGGSSYSERHTKVALPQMCCYRPCPQNTSCLLVAPWHWIMCGMKGWEINETRLSFKKYFSLTFDVPKDIMPEIANMKIEMK